MVPVAGRESDRAKANVLNWQICLSGLYSLMGQEIVLQGILANTCRYISLLSLGLQYGERRNIEFGNCLNLSLSLEFDFEFDAML